MVNEMNENLSQGAKRLYSILLKLRSTSLTNEDLATELSTSKDMIKGFTRELEREGLIRKEFNRGVRYMTTLESLQGSRLF
jgi:DNA-binding transcriptional regulator GbsR (MarR family)